MKPITSLFLFLLSIFLLCIHSCKQTPPPTAVTPPLAIPKPDSSVTLLFCGDIMLHAPQIQSALDPESGDYHFLPCFQHIAPFWVGADFTVANLETTLGCDDFSGYPRFRSPWQIARDLRKAGMSALLLANNHCCDQGEKGICQTLHYLDSLRIPHTGIFRDTLSRPLYLRKGDFKIALLNYTYGTNGLPVPKGFVIPSLDTNRMLRDIAQARRDSATHIAAFLHWGDEYHTTPNNAQRHLARWLHIHGVSLVIGSHPHVVQPVEYVIHDGDTTGITAYSLGNFISNQSRPGTDRGICLLITLTYSAQGHTRHQAAIIPVLVRKTFENGQCQYHVIPSTPHPLS